MWICVTQNCNRLDTLLVGLMSVADLSFLPSLNQSWVTFSKQKKIACSVNAYVLRIRTYLISISMQIVLISIVKPMADFHSQISIRTEFHLLQLFNLTLSVLLAMEIMMPATVSNVGGWVFILINKRGTKIGLIQQDLT